MSPAISSETRTFKGKILIQNDGLKLRPGMFVKADIVVNKADSAIIIPKDVIQSNRRVKYVYIVEKNTALLRELKTGLEDDKNIQILEGLKENDNLVVKGFETLKRECKGKSSEMKSIIKFAVSNPVNLYVGIGDPAVGQDFL